MASPHPHGEVLHIHIAPTGRAAMQSVPQVLAVAGVGLEGDRYFNRSGSFVNKHGKISAGQEATLVAVEALEALAAECGIRFKPGESRRNLLTRGIDLNALVGHEFTVGPARLKGIKLCEPCDHLEALTARGVKRGLAGRGGLRAQIVTGGVIRVGDRVIDAMGAGVPSRPVAEARSCA